MVVDTAVVDSPAEGIVLVVADNPVVVDSLAEGIVPVVVQVDIALMEIVG